MKKRYFILVFVVIFSVFANIAAFSSPDIPANSCYSGAYPISSPVSRGIQRMFGLNLLTTWAAEFAIKNQVSKQLQKGNIKVHLKAYSAGDLLAGKIKSFEITGKNVVFNDIYISSLKAQSLCDFTYIDYTKTPVMLNSPLFVKFNAEVSNAEFNKIFASDTVKSALQDIKVKINGLDFGEVDFTNVKPSINKERITIKADLVYRRTPFTLTFPISFETDLKAKDDKIFLTHLKFFNDSADSELKFITNSIELNNISIFDLKTVEKQGSEINVNKIKVIDDKISLDGTFWQPQTLQYRKLGGI